MRWTTTSRWRRAAAPAAALVLVGWLARHATAPAVRDWSPGSGQRERCGPLECRLYGRGTSGIVLLHGLVSSGDQFGRRFDPLGRDARVLVPDLIGFGRSMELAPRSFTLDDHLDALDAAIDAAGLGEAPLTLAGHSLGAILAVHLAARRPSQVEKVVMWSPPIARDRPSAKRAIRSMGLLERLFALDGRLSRRACEWMCRHRQASALLAVALNPSIPAALSLGSVRHTWPAYRDSMNDVVLDQTWPRAMQRVSDAGIPIVLAAGDGDEVADAALHRELAARHPNLVVHAAAGAGHLLPLTHGDWSVAQLADERTRTTGGRRPR